jgi:hypothetical protein
MYFKTGVLGTSGNTAQTSTTKMTILGNGYVGIGTTSPLEKLHIASGNIRVDDTTYASQYGVLYKGANRFLHNFNYGNNGTVTTDGLNTFLGVNAGNFTMGSTATQTSHASYNTGIGSSALFSNTTGNYNSAQGYAALFSNTTGSYNSAQGYGALYSNTTGNYNSAQGMYALYSNTTGSGNSAQGYQAGRYLADGSTGRTTGNNGLYLGYSSKASADGTDNEIVIGYNAIGLGSNTVVLGNTSIVTTVLRGNVGIGTTSPNYPFHVVVSGNVTGMAVQSGAGSGALKFGADVGAGTLTAGVRKLARITMPAFDAGVTNVMLFSGDVTGTDVNDVYFGGTPGGSQYAATGIHFVTALNGTTYGGTERLTVLNTGNVGIGTTTPTQTLDVAGSIAIPMTTTSTSGVLYKDTYRFLHNYKASGTQGENFFAGVSAGNFTMSSSGSGASYNTGVGTLSLTALTNGSDNTAVGYGTLSANAGGSYNSAFGKNALASNTSSWYNTAVGMNSLNTATTGGANSALGNGTLQNNVSGGENVAVGHQAGKGTPTLSNIAKNVLIGFNAGLDIRTGANSNIMIGYAAGDNVSTGATNILIGADIEAQSATGSNQLSIGNLIFGTGGFGTVTTVGAGNIGIGTATPGQKLSVAGTFGISGGSYYTIFQGGAQTANLTYTLPTALASAGQQLTDVTGNGVLSWSAAGSLRSMKNIDTQITDPNVALNQLLATNIYAFHYKQGMGTGDTKTQYVGVMADEASWAMHYDGRVINPVNTLGYMVLGIQATNQKIDSLSLATDTNITTLSGLQSSVDTKLDIIGDSLTTLTTKNQSFTDRLTTQETGIFSLTTSLTTHESRLTTLESEMATLKAEHLALFDFYSTFKLGDAVMKDKNNNVDLLGGRLTAKIVETGGLVITVSDPDRATIGKELYRRAKNRSQYRRKP